MKDILEFIGNFDTSFIDSKLSEREKMAISLASLVANQNFEAIEIYVNEFLDKGFSGNEIYEVVLHTSPYCGYFKAGEALELILDIFNVKGIEIQDFKTVKDENRYSKGLEVQRKIFGENVGKINESMLEDEKITTKFLSENCFGDLYTRSSLDLKLREMITLAVLIANGCCSSQVKSHTVGNLNVGNEKEKILALALYGVIFNGFPKTLNALKDIKEVLKEN